MYLVLAQILEVFAYLQTFTPLQFKAKYPTLTPLISAACQSLLITLKWRKMFHLEIGLKYLNSTQFEIKATPFRTQGLEL